MSKIIDIQGLFKNYGKRNVLNDLCFELDNGEIAVIYGKSGCGKSTFLNILGLLDSYDSGVYKFNEVQMGKKSVMSRIRANDIGFVFQAYQLLEGLSVYDNIVLPFLYNNQKVYNLRERVTDVLEKFNMNTMIDKKVAVLSGGEKQRVAIARAMIKKPKLVIADEPTGNLDDYNTGMVVESINEIREKGTAVVIVTHNTGIAFAGSKSYELKEGKLFVC